MSAIESDLSLALTKWYWPFREKCSSEPWAVASWQASEQACISSMWLSVSIHSWVIPHHVPCAHVDLSEPVFVSPTPNDPLNLPNIYSTTPRDWYVSSEYLGMNLEAAVACFFGIVICSFTEVYAAFVLKLQTEKAFWVSCLCPCMHRFYDWLGTAGDFSFRKGWVTSSSSFPATYLLHEFVP